MLKDDLLRVLPIWVTFPSIPLHLWSKSTLSEIASAVGRPVSTDKYITRKLRVSYAIVLIEIDVTQSQKKNISVTEVDGRKICQDVVYEWVPSFVLVLGY